MSLSLVDIFFVVTVILLVFNGLKNGALFSLISLLVLPIGFAVAYYFGPTFTVWLASSSLNVSPLVSYAILFIGTIIVLHILGNFLRRVLKVIPLFGQLDTLLGGVIGFVEAWLIWLILLIVIGTFLGEIQAAIEQGKNAFPGINIQFGQFQQWHNLYNDTVTHSLFAQVNGWFVKVLPAIKGPTPLK